MLTVQETVDKFLIPVTNYRTIGSMQKILVGAATNTNNEYLAVTRLLSIMFDTNVKSLLDEVIADISVNTKDQAIIEMLTPVNELLTFVESLKNNIRTMIVESSNFLPQPTIDLLKEYNTDGAPLERLAVAVFVILTANL